MQTLKDKINAAHGIAARQSDWTEKQLIAHMKKKGANESDTKTALTTFRNQ